MLRRLIVLSACSVVCLTGLARSTFAEDPAPKTEAPTQEAMQKAWEEAMTPGEEHKKMAECVGDWTASIEDFSSGAPVKSEGIAKFTMILGGRYLQQEYHGSMGGESFDGIGITGYDNVSKSFQEIWIDSMGTAVYFASGKRVDENTTETKGKMTMPGLGAVDTRSVVKHADKDHMLFDMYGPGPDGKEMLWIRISYARKA